MKRWKFNGAFAALAMFGVLAAACDSPVDLEEHPEGAVFFRADGTEVARFVYPNTVSGQLQVGVGETAVYDVRILLEGGELAEFDGSEYSIRAPSVLIALAATISLDSPNQLVLTGLDARQTSVGFQLYHGEHEEFRVSGVPLVVE